MRSAHRSAAEHAADSRDAAPAPVGPAAAPVARPQRPAGVRHGARGPRRGALLAGIAAAVLSACASTHGLRPEATLKQPDTLQAHEALAATAVAPGTWPDTQWWKAFADPQLNALMDEALAGSPTLRVAEARTRLALAQVAAVDSSRYPSAGVDGQAVRGRFSQNGLLPPPFAGTWATVAQLDATLSWQLDLWGKNRAAFESAVGQERAAALDVQSARLALSVNVAHVYAQLSQAYLLLDVAQATLQQRQQIYALTRDRNAQGLDSLLEVKQAEAALPEAREQIDQLQEVADHARNALAALLGAGPDRALRIQRPEAQAPGAAVLPASLPSELLGHRPDLLAQRWRVEAASRGIDQAKADFYPNVNLIAFIGWQDIGPAAFLAAANRQYGAAPAFSLPLFDAGKRRATLAARDAQYDAAVEQYNQSLSDALRDVVDALTSMRSLERQRAEQRDSLAAAQAAYDLAVLRYREGLGNYLEVLSTESALLEQRSLEVQLRARGLDASIDLIGAVGGGYVPQAGAASPGPPQPAAGSP